MFTAKILRWQLGIIIALLLGGCYPTSPTYVEDYDIVLTNYNKNFDFSTHKTYALPDSIVKITGAAIDNGGEPDFIDQDNADLILDQIRANLNANGWTETDSLTADMIILPSAFQNTEIVYYYDWWYWGWYYPYYPGGGWGWYYPGYAPYPSVSSYKTGTLLLQMTYPDGLDSQDNIPVEWTCVINGLLEDNNASLAQRVKKSIDQAFIQSPYLK